MRWRKMTNAFATRSFLVNAIYFLTCWQSVVDGRQSDSGGVKKKVYILMNPVNRTADLYQNKTDNTPSMENALGAEIRPVAPPNKETVKGTQDLGPKIYRALLPDYHHDSDKKASNSETVKGMEDLGPKIYRALLPDYHHDGDKQASNSASHRLEPVGLPAPFLLKEPLAKNYSVCKTIECHLVALSFKTLLNFSASPCHDFETFICGNLKNSKKIPKSELQTSLVNTIHAEVLKRNKALLETPKVEKPKDSIETVRAFYQGCVAADQLEADKIVPTIKKALKAVGGMPFLGDTGFNASEDWTTHVAKVFRTLAVDVIIGFGIGSDVDNKHFRLLNIAEPDTFGLSTEDLLGQYNESKEAVFEYTQLMRKTLCLLRVGHCGTPQYEQIKDIVDFEIGLAKLTSPTTKRTYYSRIFRKKPLSYLIENVPEINWKAFIKTLFKNTVINFSEESPLGFLDEEYFKKLATFLSKTKKETIGNYIGWRAFRKLPVFTTKPFKTFSFDFLEATAGVTEIPTSEHLCTETAAKLFPLSLGRLYVDRYFDKESQFQAETLINNLKSSMRLLIDQNFWMDNPTKLEARKKLQEMEAFVGSPSWIFQDSALTEREYLYHGGPFDTHEFVDSMVRLYEQRVKRLFGRIFVEIRLPEWPLSPADANAVYDNSRNSLAVPAAILQPSFFYSGTLQSLNYGAIGTILGHEIMHAFDLNGGDYDLHGNEHTWWTNATKVAYNKKKQCFIDQYSSIVDKQTNMHLNGNLTVAENLNDHAGVAQAYHAFITRYPMDVRLPGLEQYSHEQLFFIAYGRIWCGKYTDEVLRNLILYAKHTPVMHRTYMPLRNVPAFARSFNCPAGSLMNPEKRCDMWFSQ